MIESSGYCVTYVISCIDCGVAYFEAVLYVYELWKNAFLQSLGNY